MPGEQGGGEVGFSTEQRHLASMQVLFHIRGFPERHVQCDVIVPGKVLLSSLRELGPLHGYNLRFGAGFGSEKREEGKVTRTHDNVIVAQRPADPVQDLNIQPVDCDIVDPP